MYIQLVARYSKTFVYFLITKACFEKIRNKLHPKTKGTRAMESRSGEMQQNPEDIVIDMTVTEARRDLFHLVGTATNTEQNPSLQKGRGDLQDTRNTFVTPPYVIWVQFLGGGRDVQDNINYDPESRNGFVKLVFGLVLMMFIICGLVAGVMNLDSVREDILESDFAYLIISVVCGVVLMAVQYAFACSPCAKSPPICYILLFLMALSAGGLCGVATMKLDTWLILCALAVTVLIVIVCFALAFSSFDFTKYMLYIIVVVVAISGCLFVYVLLKMFLNIEVKPLHIGLLVLAVVAHGILLVMELQMILGGRKYQLEEDDYALGASFVFMAIVIIFLDLLQLAQLLSD